MFDATRKKYSIVFPIGGGVEDEDINYPPSDDRQVLIDKSYSFDTDSCGGEDNDKRRSGDTVYCLEYEALDYGAERAR